MELNNISNQKRKKQPEKVRSDLLKATATIILNRGIEGLTLDAAARKAGVSKGGLLHHFPSKQELLNGVFDESLEQIEEQINAYIEQDPNPYARFTRAYLSMNNWQSEKPQSQLMMTLTLAMSTDEVLRQRWLNWFERQLDKAGPEERQTDCWLARFASDGLWLSDLTQTPQLSIEQRKAIFEKLIAMTL